MGGADFDAVKIVKADASIGATNRAAGSLTTSQATYSFGGAEDLWGETWTAANINNSNFGVVVAFQGTGHIVVDYLTWYLKATNFGFSIPDGATIDGIKADISAKLSGFGIISANVYWIKITVYYTEGAEGTNIKVNVDDAEKNVSAIKVNVDDVEKSVIAAIVNKDDAWKTIF